MELPTIQYVPWIFKTVGIVFTELFQYLIMKLDVIHAELLMNLISLHVLKSKLFVDHFSQRL